MSKQSAAGMLDLLGMFQEQTVQFAWGKISEAVRHAGKEILKNPRQMAGVLRMAADALDRYADDQEKGKAHV